MSIPDINSNHTTRHQAITDIVASVALEQSALSHILNAEGEKLQQAVHMQCIQPTQLLDINRSVERMVHAISRLEMVLQSKLEMFEDCICDNSEIEPQNCTQKDITC